MNAAARDELGKVELVRPSNDKGDAGTRVIIVYKALKAFAEVVLLAIIVWLSRGEEHSWARGLAEWAQHHLASWWATSLSRMANSALTGHGLHVVELALLLDAAWTGLEGWSLWRNFRWAPWFVVLATLVPLPWELLRVLRRPSIPRIAVLAGNVAITAYLAKRIAGSSRRNGSKDGVAEGSQVIRP
ncbi:MAG TPA: DUF2127 domain-containing protein [Anaeromyxobacteraceae bacterium]|nr:DUF2127 domain-containing protein [Anaeromyxobacteraceae bacterium]